MTYIMEGKVKTLFGTDKPDQLLIQFEDKVTAGNGRKVDFPEDKGAICCEISRLFFEYLEREHVCATHYLSMPTHRALCVKKLKIIPVEVILRNVAAGGICRDSPIPEGTVFDPPLVEFNYKCDEKNDPLLTDDRVSLMGYDPKTFRRRATELNFHFQKIFGQMGLTVVDYKLEYGVDDKGHLFLADELSPDNFRLWKDGKSFDKDLFRKDEGNIVDAYRYILTNLKEILE